MVWFGNRLRRLGRAKHTGEEAGAAPHRLPDDPGPPLVMLLPDAVGTASYQWLAFPDAGAATAFMDGRFRGQLEEGIITFWALTRDPDLDGHRAIAEPLLIIRDAKGPGVVYPFSFADSESAYAFIRKEMEHGLELRQLALYWAVTVHASIDPWGKSSLSPAAPPAGAQAAATPPTADAAAASDDGDHHLPLLDAWQSAQRRPIGGPTSVVRREEQSPAGNGTPDSAGPADGNGGRPVLPAQDSDEATARAIDEALRIVHTQRNGRRHGPDLPEAGESSGAAGPETTPEGLRDPSTPADGLDESALARMIEEIEQFRRRMRWDDRQGPFKGFGSPPGKF